MTKFEEKPWYRNVRRFFNERICQYTFQEKEITFATVHITSSLPFISSRIWLQMAQRGDNTVKGFVSNQWAAQINLDENLMQEQHKWEVTFWEDTIKRGGQNYDLGFHEKFWVNKASDKYPLINHDGSLWH